MVTLRGGRVVLREKRPEDAPNDYRWRTDEELSRLDAAAPLRMSFREFARYYQDELRYPTPWSRRFAIDTAEGKHIGNCMYYDIDAVAREAEVGIMIGDKAYWSQGYGFDAMVLLVEHIFDTTPMERLYLHTLEWNTRARRSFQRCGFVEVGLVRRGGYTFMLMELRRQRWQQVRQEKLALLLKHAEQGQDERNGCGPRREPASGEPAAESAGPA